MIEYSASALGLHPDVHVLFPENVGQADRHFILEEDSYGKEYRDRKRHSTIRNAWEAAAAVCTAMNTRAGEAALRLVSSGKVELLSRSALIGASTFHERLQIAYQGKITGASYFEVRAEYVVLVLIEKDGFLGLLTTFPTRGGKNAPPAGFDSVRGNGAAYQFAARESSAGATAG